MQCVQCRVHEEKLLEMMYKVKTLQGGKGRFSQSLENSSSTSDTELTGMNCLHNLDTLVYYNYMTLYM